MEIEEKIRIKFDELIKSSEKLKSGGQYGLVLNNDHSHLCYGWFASAQNIVHLVVSNPDSPYRISVDKLCNVGKRDSQVHISVGGVGTILKSLLQDIDQGLLASIENQTKAIVFDNFLDHGKEYSKQNKPKEAGVIAGVVFEDTLRTICRNLSIEEKGKPLDLLIDELVKINVLSQTKAKRAKAGAHVRTKATHAQWNEFDLKDVDTTIEFTEELILKHIEN